MWFDFLELIFPKYCYSCTQKLHKSQNYFCVSCNNSLPYVIQKSTSDNEIHQRFFNKLKVSEAFAYFYYYHKSYIGELLHDFKYQNLPQIGVYYGVAFADNIMNTSNLKYDYVIPVPMHKSKLKKRGYNQAEVIAKEISKKLNVPLLLNNVEKVKSTSSQTKLGRIDRWLNSKDVYKIEIDLSGKTVLLVDDVITTGATLESLGNECFKSGAKQVSVAGFCLAT